MKVVVFGSRGMLGQAVTTFFKKENYTVVPVSRDEFDIAKAPFADATKFLSGAEVVINCAGVIKPHIAKMSIEDVLKVNSVFPRNLAKYSAIEGVKCFHVTTDCVYSGSKGQDTEEDLFDATDVYGISKNGGDTTDCMTLRTSIIGEEKGQARSLLEWARSQKGKEVSGYLNHVWNGVCTTYLAEIIHNIVKAGAYQKGLFHVHSPEAVNKYELVSLLSEVYDLGLTVKPVDGPEFCDRSLKSIYPISSKFATKPLRQQLVEMKQTFAA